jgi:hypothetical protein
MAFRGTFAGLKPSTTGSWHMHRGLSCAPHVLGGDADHYVHGHYFDADADGGYGIDVWSNPEVTYETSADGAATIDRVMEGFTLADKHMASRGRNIVVHLDRISMLKVGCGSQAFELPPSPPSPPPRPPSPRPSPPPTPAPPPPPLLEQLTRTKKHAVVSLGAYARYPRANNEEVGGTLLLQDGAGGALHIVGLITGLTPLSSGGWHIHTGVTCDTAARADGKHYYDEAAGDPWTGDGASPSP